MPNIKSFGHTASEEMQYEIVDDDRRTTTDDRRTTDTYLSYKLTFEPSVEKTLKSIHELISDPNYRCNILLLNQ